MNLMFAIPQVLWAEWLSSVAAATVAVSCFFALNHLPRSGRTLYKVTMFAVWVGAFGVAVSPFMGHFTSPTAFEILLRSGSAVFAVWHTWPFWHELPLLDRRSVTRCGTSGPSVRAVVAARGTSTEEEQPLAHYR